MDNSRSRLLKLSIYIISFSLSVGYSFLVSVKRLLPDGTTQVPYFQCPTSFCLFLSCKFLEKKLILNMSQIQ